MTMKEVKAEVERIRKKLWYDEDYEEAILDLEKLERDLEKQIDISWYKSQISS